MKRITIFFIVLVINLSCIAYLNAMRVSVLPPKQVKIKYTFAVDLHGVIVNSSAKQIIKHAMRMNNKSLFIKHMFNPYVWKTIHKTVKKTKLLEEIFESLVVEHPQLHIFHKDLLAFSNAQIVNSEMLVLLQQLKKEGHSLILCSNIGPEIYTDFCKKFPQVIQLFDNYFITQKTSKGYITKRHPDFYSNFKVFLKNNNYDYTKTIIIDDKQSNLDAAQKQGLSGIIFKSVKKLRKKLAI
ncbi:MAG: hypothetical protein P4L22_05740 [Candidatus Babeliales bacterium]|nr:hypothetical protein [Candidatus Babeliales bacterium]